MAENQISTSKEGTAFIITLNRPEKRNAISHEMMNALDAAVDEAAYSNDTRGVIIHGVGKCFCSGIDFNSLAGIGQRSSAVFRYFLTGFQNIFTKLETMEKPVIAAIHGYCFGMGTELALAADFRIVTEDTEMAIQEVELGLVPDVGGTTRVTRTVGIARAKELILLARKLNAKRAYEIGLVTEVVPEGKHLETALEWVADLKRCAPLAVGIAKKLIDRGAHLDKMTFMQLEGLAQSTILHSDDVKEGVMARIQKRDPDFKGK